MKTLLLLLLLAACGKHEMPPENDMNDSDGDSIPNYREVDMDKYISNIVPLQVIETEISFQSQKYFVSNKIELTKYTRDLLIKNTETLKSNDYFSEFSHMRMKEGQIITLIEPGIVRVTLKTSDTPSEPKSVFLVYPDRKILLGEFKQNMEINISSEDLNAVLKSEANLAITHLSAKILFFDKTQDDTIREKTFRVLMNDGSKPQILYMSKELSFEQILKHFKIKSYKNIEEENLLTTSRKSSNPEWWIRKLNDRDIIIIKESLSELRDHFFEGFEKKKLQLNRLNGVAQNNLVITKNASAKVLLKISGLKSEVSFSVEKKKKSDNVARDKYWVCDLYYRYASQPQEIQLKAEEILNHLRLNGLTPSKVQVLGSDLEVEIITDATEFDLNLENFAQNQYLPVGLYDKKCDKTGTSGPELKSNLQASESSLSLKIEAFVEKI